MRAKREKAPSSCVSGEWLWQTHGSEQKSQKQTLILGGIQWTENFKPVWKEELFTKWVLSEKKKKKKKVKLDHNKFQVYPISKC